MNLKLTAIIPVLILAFSVSGQPLTQSELAWRTPTGGGLFDIPPTAGTLFLLYPAGTNMPITLPGGDDNPGYTFSIGASPTNGLISNLSALAGTLDYTNTTGSNNDYFNYTVHEADGPLTAFGEVYIIIYSNQFLIPFMTGYSSPSNSASASRESSGNFAYDAFQWNASVPSTSTEWISGGSAPQWVKYTFDSPQAPVAVRYYVLFASSFGGSTQSFQLQASNDGFIATTNILDTETGITGASGVNGFDLNNTAHYSSYRLYITSVSGVWGGNGAFQLFGHF